MGQNTIVLTGGISTTVQREIVLEDLAPNNYLTIIWKDPKTNKQLNTFDVDRVKSVQYTNDLNNAIETAISNNNVSYAGQNRFVNIESIAKYVSQNIFDSGTQRTVVDALIGLASGGQQKLPNNTVNLLINVFGSISKDTARSLGYSDPQNLFSQITGQNCLTVFGELGKKTQDFLDTTMSKLLNKNKNSGVETSANDKGEKRYAGLLLGLTTNDTESYDITIPRKKVEDGSDYTTHLLPQPFKKDFTVILTNKILTSDYKQSTEIEAIEFTKNKMIEIAKSRTPFDIYIRLSKDKMYKKTSVVFSSLSFDKDTSIGNSYTATFTIEPIENFKTKTFVSNKKFIPKSSSSGSRSSSSKGSGNSSSGSGKRGEKTSNNKPLIAGYQDTGKTKGFNSVAEMRQEAKPDYRVLYSPNLNPHYLFVPKSSIGSINGVPCLKVDEMYYYKNKVNKYTATNSYNDTNKVFVDSGTGTGSKNFVHVNKIMYYIYP